MLKEKILSWILEKPNSEIVALNAAVVVQNFKQKQQKKEQCL